jgi:PRTRC genetic system protein E
MAALQQRCRICGCTQDDCRQCIEKTGAPCYWVDSDLCSACSPQPSPNSNLNMEFFKLLAAQFPAGLDLTLKIKEKNGKFTASVLPAAGTTGVLPIIITGEPAELDQEFLPRLAPVIKDTTVTVLNLEAHQASVKEAEEKAKKEDSKKTPAKKAKPAAKKAAPEKEAAPAPADTADKVTETSLFD